MYSECWGVWKWTVTLHWGSPEAWTHLPILPGDHFPLETVPSPWPRPEGLKSARASFTFPHQVLPSQKQEVVNGMPSLSQDNIHNFREEKPNNQVLFKWNTLWALRTLNKRIYHLPAGRSFGPTESASYKCQGDCWKALGVDLHSQNRSRLRGCWSYYELPLTLKTHKHRQVSSKAENSSVKPDCAANRPLIQFTPTRWQEETTPGKSRWSIWEPCSARAKWQFWIRTHSMDTGLMKSRVWQAVKEQGRLKPATFSDSHLMQ